MVGPEPSVKILKRLRQVEQNAFPLILSPRFSRRGASNSCERQSSPRSQEGTEQGRPGEPHYGGQQAYCAPDDPEAAEVGW